MSSAIPLIIEIDLFVSGAVQKNVLYFLGKLAERCVYVKAVMLCQRIDHLKVEDGIAMRPRSNSSSSERETGVRNDKVGIKPYLNPEPPARFTCSVRIVEREKPGRD